MSIRSTNSTQAFYIVALDVMNRKQRRAGGSGAEPPIGAAGKTVESATLAELFGAAVRDHQAGALNDAERRYRHLLSLFPNHTDSLQNLGLIALQRGDAAAAAEFIAKAIQLNDRVAEYHYNMALACRAQGRADEVARHLESAIKLRGDYLLAHINLGNVHREQGRAPEAIVSYERAIALAPDSAAAHFNLANIFLEQRRLDEAIGHFKQAVAAEPKHAEAHAKLGSVLTAQGNARDAVFHYEQTLILQPDFPGVHEALGKAYVTIGELIPAVQAAQRAVELHETDETRQSFAQCVRLVRFTSENPALRNLVLRALKEGWARPRDLAGVCISAIKLDSAVKDLILRVNSAWPERLPPEEMLGESGAAALAQNPLLRAQLDFDLLADLDLERIFTNLRYAMLANLDTTEPDEKLLALYCSVARQCFNNQYIFAMTPDEAEQARNLRESLQQALAAEKPFPVLWPVIAGAYSPLQKLVGSDALLDPSWPETVRELIVRQVGEPAEERRIAETIPVLTKIGDGVSSAVRDQYEENPYPRWIEAGPPVQPTILAGTPPASIQDVLIAGCGTGLSTIELARQAHHARILAIDLSLASLSYAKRMAQKFGISNVEFAQADITQLDSLSRTFDFIDASGVLHHLADPWHGWRVLLARLRPGGTMQVGLYSALARQSVVAARALIAVQGYRPTSDDIRRFRQDIIASTDPLAKSVSHWSDFYSMDECRDLLFHVQEHRTTLQEIKSFLTANNVQFAGIVPDPAVLRRFTARFPDRAALLDLDCWHSLEIEAPDTFAGMYQFWVSKLAA
jgi:tetratricopeptide (TPR) repeat protein/SAM-dependent methyltransferase